MTAPDDPAIYHLTHLDNLAGIIRQGHLWSDAECSRRRLAVTAIGYEHIKERRLHRPVPVAAGGFLGDYVPFHFCPRSVMLYVLHRGHSTYQGGQRPIVHLVSSVRTAVASGGPWAFTDRHAELRYAQYFDQLDALDQVDWSAMPARYWSESEVKERRQAELLVHKRYPWTAVSAIGVCDRRIRDRVARRLESADHRPAIRVEPGWYY